MKFCPTCGLKKKPGQDICPKCGFDFETDAGSPLTPVPESGSISIGQLIGGRYKSVSLLGKGGMGRVYRAYDIQLDEDVAIKMIETGLAKGEMLQRFLREIKLARTVTHENVCRIYDLMEMDSFRFISMQYIDGTDLKSRMHQEGAIDIERGIAISIDILKALEAIHKKGIIHRDLKPANIMIDSTGKAYITDFGIAKSGGDHDLTKSGEMIGTPHYMSPEQIEGKSIDFRADIYSFGVVMYHMFTGKTPFSAESSVSLAIKHLKEKVEPPDKINPAIPREISDLILKCMEKDPAKRFSSAGEIRKILERISIAKDRGRGTATMAADSSPTISERAVNGSKMKGILIISVFVVAAIILLILFLGKDGSEEGSSPFPPRNDSPSDSASGDEDSSVMVKVTGGSVTLGSYTYDDDNPVKTVNLGDFYIDKYEVTNSDYTEFINSTGFSAPPSWGAGHYPSGEEDFPVTSVTLNDARAYCKFRGKRLPTEQEWEWAARRSGGLIYPWGDEPDSGAANLTMDYPRPVGSFPQDKNPEGIYDLAGNVAEWTDTVFEQGGKKYVVVKGGSFAKLQDAAYARLAKRRIIQLYDNQPIYKNIGFRCVRDIK